MYESLGKIEGQKQIRRPEFTFPHQEKGRWRMCQRLHARDMISSLAGMIDLQTADARYQGPTSVYIDE